MVRQTEEGQGKRKRDLIKSERGGQKLKGLDNKEGSDKLEELKKELKG